MNIIGLISALGCIFFMANYSLKLKGAFSDEKYKYKQNILHFTILLILITTFNFILYATEKGEAGEGILLQIVEIVLTCSLLIIGFLFTVLARRKINWDRSTTYGLSGYIVGAGFFNVLGLICLSLLLSESYMREHHFIVLLVTFLIGIFVPISIVLQKYLQIKREERELFEKEDEDTKEYDPIIEESR